MTINEEMILLAESMYAEYIDEVTNGTCGNCAEVLCDNTPFCNYCGEISQDFSCEHWQPYQPQNKE